MENKVFYVKLDHNNHVIEFLTLAPSYGEVMKQIEHGWEDMDNMYGIVIIPLEDDFVYCKDFKEYLSAGRNEVKDLAIDNTER